MTEQISHRCGLHLETRHWRGLTAHDLMNQLPISDSFGNSLERGPQQSLTGQTMTAGAVDPEQLPAMVSGALQIQSGPDVRILTGIPQNPEQQHDAGTGGEHHQGGDQSTTPFFDDGSLFRSS